MNAPNGGAGFPFMAPGKVGRGAFSLKLTILERGRSGSSDVHARIIGGTGRGFLAQTLAAEQPRGYNALLTGSVIRIPSTGALLDPLQLSPAQTVLGRPRGDHELRRRTAQLHAAAEGVRLIELVAKDSRLAGKGGDLELSAGEGFALDSSRLSCGQTERQL